MDAKYKFLIIKNQSYLIFLPILWRRMDLSTLSKRNFITVKINKI